MSVEKAARIRELNDAFRTSLQGGRALITAAVNALPPETVAAALRRTQTFSEFTEDNDPDGLHDFGSFELAGETFFWKIDYYDTGMQWGSEDPSDPAVTTRVITLMLAADY
jgi:hypothetical protein